MQQVGLYVITNFYHYVYNVDYVHDIETESERQSERGSLHVLEIMKTLELLSDDCMCTT